MKRSCAVFPSVLSFVISGLTLLLAALAVAGCGRERVPFDPAQARVITEETDLMTHCSSFLPGPDGTVYFAYYHDTTQTLEAPGKTTITDVLAVSRRPDFATFDRTEFMCAGDTVGTFVQSPERAPYDPNLLLVGDTLFVYFNGCIDGTVTFCARRYDTRAGRFEDEVTPCTLHYDGKAVPLDTRGIFGMFADRGFEATYNNDITISAPFVEYGGAWYIAVGNAFLPRSCPFVIRTVNGVDFDLVMFCPDFLYGCCEAALAIWKDEFYVVMRNSGVERGGRGTYVARYDASGRCLVSPRYLSEAQSKPGIVLYKGRMYLFYNANPFLQTDWGLVSRSRFRISEIDRDCRIRRSWDITSPYGIHYPYVREMDGRLWMTFTEDRRQLDVNQTRSNLSLTELEI